MEKGKVIAILICIVLVLALILCLFCVRSVPTGHTGILTTFGKIEDNTVSAGVHWIAPWQRIVKLDNRAQKVDLKAQAFSSDIQQVDVQMSVNYCIDQVAARELYRTVGEKYYDTIIYPRILENTKAVFVRYTAEDLVSNLSSLSDEIEDLLVNDVSSYGITIISLAIEHVDFTDVFTSTDKDYVTPEMYGAKGDGVTDDTAAFNAALNTGKVVFLQAKTYRLASALNNPNFVHIIGSGNNKSSGTVINCGSSFLSNAINRSVIRDCCIIAPFNNNLTAFPSDITGSVISRVFTQYWNIVFSRLKTDTVIEDSAFEFIRGSFCASLVDSIICHNYINAPKLKNPQTICFSGTVANSIINANFIDYMYAVFKGSDASHSLKSATVTGNEFDLCYTIVYNTASGLTFTGNTITGLHKSENWDVSENNDMNTKDWAVIRRDVSVSALTNCVFSGNTFQYTNFDAYMVCDTYSYPTCFLTIDDEVPADKVDFKAYKSANAHDMEKVMIRPLLKRTVDSLPSADITGRTIISFPFDEVIYNGDLYLNIGGTWKKLTNDESI